MRDIQKSIMGNGVLQALMKLAILLAFPIRKALFMSESQFEKLFWTQYYTGENVCRWPVSVYAVDSLPKIHYLYQKATRSSIGIDYLH